MENQHRNMSMHVVTSSVYDDSDSDSDIDLTPPTIIKRKSDLPKKPKSKYKGVFRCGKKFKAQIQTTGVQHYLGLFDVEEDAARAYDTHARATFGAKAKTNFVYDPAEPIPHADTALAPAKSIVVPMRPAEIPPSPEPEKVVVKGSHPRRTYVGIKARRKRLSGTGDDDENENSNTGTESDMEGSNSSRNGINNGSNSSGAAKNSMPVNKMPRIIKNSIIPTDPKWRDRVCYLVGGLFINNSNDGRLDTAKTNVVHVCLKGKWLSSPGEKPSRNDITSWSNKNEFYYESLAQENLDTLSLPNNNLRPLSGNYTGFHFIDQKEGGTDVPTKCTETLLQLLFTPDSKDSSHCSYDLVGKGDSDLGKFILFGNYNSQSRDITMSRQFVTDSDPCNDYSLQLLQEKHKSGLATKVPRAVERSDNEAQSGSEVVSTENGVKSSDSVQIGHNNSGEDFPTASKNVVASPTPVHSESGDI